MKSFKVAEFKINKIDLIIQLWKNVNRVTLTSDNMVP